MNFTPEFALLIAVAIPVLAIVGLNVFVAVCGERGTLLWPSARPFETGSCAVAGFTEPAAVAVATIPVAANDEQERQAA